VRGTHCRPSFPLSQSESESEPVSLNTSELDKPSSSRSSDGGLSSDRRRPVFWGGGCSASLWAQTLSRSWAALALGGTGAGGATSYSRYEWGGVSEPAATEAPQPISGLWAPSTAHATDGLGGGLLGASIADEIAGPPRLVRVRPWWGSASGGGILPTTKEFTRSYHHPWESHQRFL
jgi:hypothetical protein